MSDAAIKLPPVKVLVAYGIEDAPIERVTLGLINETYFVEHGAHRLVLQRLHPVFDATVNLDIDAITAHLERAGLVTPRPVRTREGELWVEAGGRAWRALTYVEGRIAPRLHSPAMAWQAGALVGRFHRALDGFQHDFHFSRPGAHDTTAHLARLGRALREHHQHRHVDDVRPVAEAILEHGGGLPPCASLPARTIHGDLKITNVLFDGELERAVALIDLDTLGHGTLDAELGDALRSWCNPAGEDVTEADVDEELFRAAVHGYASEARALLEPPEIRAIVPGTERIALELAARFCHDALAEQYFAWDPDRFESASQHNLARARGQLALARSVRLRRPDLEGMVTEAFTSPSR